jgi:hypothetical protein
MNKMKGMRTVAIAAAVLGAAALTAGTDSAMAQTRMHSNAGGWHGSFHSGGWHGTGGHFNTFRGGHVGTFRGGHVGTFRGAFNHRGWVWRGGRWWHPGWRGGVAVGFYGYPYYGYPYYGGYYPYNDYGAYDYDGYDNNYDNAYDNCDADGDYDDEDCGY